MIHYHGGPVTPATAAIALWTARHAFCSFEYPHQTPIAAEVCQSFALDNGAFTKHNRGEGEVDLPAFAEWIARWSLHPGFDWCLIPDSIAGGPARNDEMLEWWLSSSGIRREWSVPVWHLDEPFERLEELARAWPRVALGSSGRYWKVQSKPWWQRMGEAMDRVCNAEGFPTVKLHGLRMLSNTIFSQIPLSSADSTNIARNIGLDKAWKGPYAPERPEDRAIIIAGRTERHAAAKRWTRTFGHQENLDLLD